jgi:hypothetical protein
MMHYCVEFTSNFGGMGSIGMGSIYYESWVPWKSWILFYFSGKNISTNKMELFCSLVELSSSTTSGLEVSEVRS